MKNLLLTIAATFGMTALTMAQNVPSYVPSNGLVGWWPFTGNANDLSGNAHNGTVNGATLTTDRFGNTNSAYAFNSSSAQSINANIGIYNTAMTFSTWFKASTPNRYYPRILTYGNSQQQVTVDYYQIGLCGNEPIYIPNLIGKVVAQCNFNNSNGLNSPSTYIDNQWHNLTVIYRPSDSIYLYMDGLKVNTVLYTGTLNFSSGSLYIGRDINDNAGACGGCGRFLGNIDDIGVWNRTLTQQEITNLYNSNLNAYTCLPNYVPTNGLVGYWPFCGNANDESGNGNNGTVNGATLIHDRFGNANKAYNFDGINDYVQITNNTTLEPLSSISISAWIFIDSTQTTNFPPIISKEAGIPSGYTSYALIGGNAGLNQLGDIGLQITTNNGGYSWTGVTGTSFLNQWVFVTGIYDGSNMKIYHNGFLTSSKPKSGNIQYQNYLLTIARSMGNSTTAYGYFKGNIDDIGIWNRVLSQQEITDLYNGNVTGFNPVTFNNTIKIFPNPTNDHITIDYGNFASLNGYQLKIINSLSQKVFQTNITQQSNYLNLTTWGGNGLYFVQIIDPQGNIIDIRKIVLQ